MDNYGFYTNDVNIGTDSKGWNSYNEWDARMSSKVGMSVSGSVVYAGCKTFRSSS